MVYKTCDNYLHTPTFNITKGDNNMDNKSDEQLIITQDTIEVNRQESDEKIMRLIEDLKVFVKSTITSMMDQTNISKSSPEQKDSLKPPEPNTVVPSHRRAAPLEGGHSTKVGDMWTPKHEIS